MFKKLLTGLRHHVEKSYWVLVEGEPTPEALSRLKNGVQPKAYTTRVAKARINRAQTCHRVPSRSQHTAWADDLAGG